MVSYVKAFIVFCCCFLFPIVTNGKDIGCYKLVETTESNIKIGSIQFISFIGDQCYESDINGISVKNGTMRKNEYQSDRNVSVYNGGCFCGPGAKFGFSPDKATLTVTSKNGNKFIFKRVSPPKDVTTCSLIRTHSPEVQGSEEFNGYIYNTVSPEVQTNQNNNIIKSQQKSIRQKQTRRKCVYCNGDGQITKDDSAPSNFGIEKPKQQCQICGKWYNPNVFVHYHQKCSHCGGTGYAK